MNYYIDIDLKTNLILVGATRPTDPPFYIQFESRFKAEDCKRKLDAGSLKDPIQKPDLYECVRTETESLGTVYYYVLK